MPKRNIVAIVPARYAATRLPGKLLQDVGGEPLILHTLRRASAARTISRVIAATDDERIFDVVLTYGFEAVMTSPTHRSGSDRIAEVAESLPLRSIIVNVQGDEPAISPDTIDKAVNAMLADSAADIVTTSEPIEFAADVLNPNIVKVVTATSGYALYFSRSPIPFPRTAIIDSGDWERAFVAEKHLVQQYRKHTGLYVYRREFLLEFAKMLATPLEQIEVLEQLRALENGAKIRVVDACSSSIGVDTPEDLERVRQILRQSDSTTGQV
ncbi:MAG: 3-deoxy-manno-octulosonate cytidylyltransferase [Acidobacteriota bacterium]